MLTAEFDFEVFFAEIVTICHLLCDLTSARTVCDNCICQDNVNPASECWFVFTIALRNRPETESNALLSEPEAGGNSLS